MSEPQLEDDVAAGIDPRCNECDDRHAPDYSCIISTDSDQAWYDMHDKY
jgi:hypothetical protein